MMQRLDRASAAVANALRILPTASESSYSSPGDFATGQRLERMIESVHALGVRPLAEMLGEIAVATGRPDIVADHVEAYARLDATVLHFLGADHFPPHVLGVVQ